MKYALTILTILFVSLGTNAQANDNLNRYILQKQIEASKTKRESEATVRQLRKAPKDRVQFVNIDAAVKTSEKAIKPSGPAGLNDISTAAGKNKLAAQK